MNRLQRGARFVSDLHMDERAKCLDAIDAASVSYELTAAACRSGLMTTTEAVDVLDGLRQTLLALRQMDDAGRRVQQAIDDTIRELGQLPPAAIAMLPTPRVPQTPVALVGVQYTLEIGDMRKPHMAAIRTREAAA